MDTKARLIELSQGVLVEEDVLGTVRKIQEYDPNLRVKYLAQHGTVTDAPYAIFELCPDGIERLVMYVWQLDDRVMERLYAADNQRINILKALDDHNTKVKADEKRRYREEMEEAKDIVEHVIASPKGTYSFNTQDEISEKKVTISDSVPAKIERK